MLHFSPYFEVSETRYVLELVFFNTQIVDTYFDPQSCIFKNVFFKPIPWLPLMWSNVMSRAHILLWFFRILNYKNYFQHDATDIAEEDELVVPSCPNICCKFGYFLVAIYKYRSWYHNHPFDLKRKIRILKLILFVFASFTNHHIKKFRIFFFFSSLCGREY